MRPMDIISPNQFGIRLLALIEKKKKKYISDSNICYVLF